MNLGFFPSSDPEKNLIHKLKSYANQIEHKFQKGRAYDFDPSYLDPILATLQNLRAITQNHSILNNISRLEIVITAAIRYYIDNKYEEFYDRVRAIADKLHDIDD